MEGRTITRDDINTNVVNFVRAQENRSWGATLEVTGLPKKFSFKALETILLGANRTAFKLMSTAMGIAYMRGHPHVTEKDAATAIEVEGKGLEQVLPQPEEEW